MLLRRLLRLDNVIEHAGLPWLPTEPEKVGAFEETRASSNCVERDQAACLGTMNSLPFD